MNNREVAHLWAAQSRTGAKGSNFYFEGATIYSYGPHFPIATIHARKDGRRAVLFTQRTYSVTTSKHQGYAHSAVSHLPSFSVPHIAPRSAREHGENCDALAASVAELAKRAMRRTREHAVQWDAKNAARAHKALADYMIFFGIRRKMPPVPGFAAAFERARRIENPDPATVAKREAAREKREVREAITGTPLAQKRQAQYAARRLAQIEREILEASGIGFYREQAARSGWRLGFPWGNASFYGRDGAIMLRINAEDIETSMGARVPLAAAPMVWNLVERARMQGGMDGRNGGILSRAHPTRLPRIGDYPLDRIDADGTLHAGCHTIPYSELASMARALGLQS